MIGLGYAGQPAPPQPKGQQVNSDTNAAAQATPATDDPRPIPRQGDDWSVKAGTEGPHYPDNGTHTWGEFAGMAIELGGYGDMTMVDPYSGQRLWMGAIRDAEGAIVDETPYAQLRRLADLAEREQFLG
jgi:hypothetical protein